MLHADLRERRTSARRYRSFAGVCAKSLRERQDMSEVRRHAGVEGVEIGRRHRGGPATLGHGKPLIQLWD